MDGIVVRRGWLVVLAAFLLLVASPAAAHTSLLGSEPENRSTVAEPPRVARLEFSQPVDPRTVSVELLSADGSSPGEPEQTTPVRPDTTVVDFDLPALAPATYGLRWRSVGRDGHVVAGEVVFTVASGDVAADAVQVAAGPVPGRGGTGLAGDVFAVVLGVGRLLWYAGLALLVGTWFLAWWRRRNATGGSDPRDAPDPRTTARWGRRWAATGLAASWVAVVGSVALGAAEPLTVEGLWTAVSSTPALLSMVALLFVASASDADLVALPETGRLPCVRGKGAILAATVVVASSGHAWTGPWPLANSAIAAVHMLGAAAWLGPLLLLAITRKRGWHRSTVAGATALHSYLAAFSRLAAMAFGVLTVTGLYAAWLHTGFDLTDGRYAAILAVKGILIAVIVGPLGVYHHRRVRSGTRDRAKRPPRPLVAARTLRVESAAGLSVLVLAVFLASSVPGNADRTIAAAATDVPTGTAAAADPARCDELVVGQANCYRDAFAGTMQREGVPAALAAIENMRDSSDFVARQCHQVAHDLGNDAAELLGLGQALAHDGSLCASGYYHGALEQTLTGIDDGSLERALPELCASVSAEPYSAVHYSCVHGVGHGLMLRSGLELFPSLELCENFDDAWEGYACWTGAFMENVVSVQEGGAVGTFRAADPLYPCSAVGEERKAACFSIQTGYILWENGGDLAGGFAACDSAEIGYVDDCYQSMGRDISGFSELDIDMIIAGCALGDPRWREWCYVGAALDAVYQENGTTTASELCERISKEYREVCRSAVDGLAARL